MKLTLLVTPDTAPNGEPGYCAHCPELDIVSQGQSESQARDNLREALEFWLEDASPAEIENRLAAGAKVWQLELAA